MSIPSNNVVRFSIQLAREQYEAPKDDIITENPFVRAMHKWLFPNEPPTQDEENSEDDESDEEDLDCSS